MPKHRVVLTERIESTGAQLLSMCADVVIAPECTDGVVGGLIADADALIARSTRVGEGLLSRGQRLKVVGRHGVGLDNIDVEAATRMGICVVHTPEANCNAVAEHTIWAMLHCARNFGAAEKALRGGAFERVGSLPGLVQKLGFTTRELSGKSLGLVGMGRIARRVAHIAVEAFGMDVRAFDPLVGDAAFASCGATRVDCVDGACEGVQFLSLHVPHQKSTHHLIGEKELRLVGPAGFVINTSRGGVLDETALAEMIRCGLLGGAALDVFEEEPPQRSCALFELENVLLTPHMAAMTDAALKRMSVDVCSGVIDVLEGRRPKFLANPVVWRDRVTNDTLPSCPPS